VILIDGFFACFAVLREEVLMKAVRNLPAAQLLMKYFPPTAFCERLARAKQQ
jgi:hypothetical protein